ncbi:MAG: site-specific integrase [Acidobacteria bacterium]|nr:site-specific integrase [Acidobacteriota bacterium]
MRESTKQGNDKVARQMEAAHRTSLAKGEVGIREKKAAPSLAKFCEQRFEPWAKSTFEETARKSWLWYRTGIRSLLSHRTLATARLNEITGEAASDFAAFRLAKGLQVSTVNSSLRVLRSILHRAAEWGVLESAPKVKLLRGERHRERVVTREEEAKYLAVAREPLASIAGVLADTGLRPEECFRLRWEAVAWLNGRYGTLLMTHGKTAAARRVLPMTPRVRFILQARWDAAGKPVEGWVWPAPTYSGHVEASSLRKQHAAALRASKVRSLVLYALRHIFLTRLGESGCDAWTPARIAGHSSIGISACYVHPSEDAVLAAISRLGGHKIGHSAEGPEETAETKLLTQ